MPTTQRSRGGRRKAAERPHADTKPHAKAAVRNEAENQTVDGALEQWSDQAARDLAAWGAGASTAFLRGMEAVREVQFEAMREAFRLQEEAASQLSSVHGAADLAQLQLTLAQNGRQAAMHSVSRIGEVAARQTFDAWKEAADGWSRWQGAAWTTAAQWFGGLAQQPTNPELIEAEVEHVVSPMAASPLVWPVQEASRQAMTLASSAWNEWLSLSNRWAEAGWGAGRR